MLAGWCWRVFGWWNWYVSFVYSEHLLCFPKLIQMSRNNEFILKSYKIVLAYHILKKKSRCHVISSELICSLLLLTLAPRTHIQLRILHWSWVFPQFLCVQLIFSSSGSYHTELSLFTFLAVPGTSHQRAIAWLPRGLFYVNAQLHSLLRNYPVKSTPFTILKSMNHLSISYHQPTLLTSFFSALFSSLLI